MGHQTRSRLAGRRVLGLVALTAVVVAAVFGYLIGIVAAGTMSHIRLGELTLFHPTPGGLALYGALATAVVLGTLFGLVQFVSQFDPDAQ